MSPIAFSIVAGVLLLVVLIRRATKGDFLKKNNLLLTGILLGGCLFLVGYHFYKRGQRTGLIAVGLGGVAAGKYLYDQREHKEGE